MFSGCMALPAEGIRDYPSLMEADQTKRVDYFCNFDRLVNGDFTQMGDYCQMADNEDYVSYFVSFDVQSTSIYKPYLVQLVNMMATENVPGQLRYFQLFSGDDYLKLTRYEVENKQPTSFALKNGESYHVVLSKADLLMRTRIYPEYSVLSLRYEGAAEPTDIGEYTARYRVAPYVFDLPYSDSASARILGLPDYESVAGRLGAVQRLQLNNYNTYLERFWQYTSQNQYNPEYITPIDYAMPQLMMRKLDMTSELTLRVAPPEIDEGLMNDYLPPYDLQEIQVVYSDGFGSERILQVFTRDDIAKVLIDYEDDAALVYTTLVNHDSLGLRFLYTAQEPRAAVIDPVLADTIGLSYIYSTLAASIEVQMNVLRFYELESLPVGCVDRPAFVAKFEEKGRTAAEANATLARMSQVPVKNCTAAQVSIGELLVNLQ
jgi:hypothetical protein